MAQFVNKLELTPIGDGRTWQLLDSLTFISDRYGWIAVRQGFLTDLASVPRIFWNILPPFGVYDCAAVVHDWLYQNRGQYSFHKATLSRAACDWVLLEAMAELGTPLWKRWIIYVNVRLFGWAAWPATSGKLIRGGQPS